MPKADGAAAVSHVDPFCDEFLADPYPFHEALREAGPVVWLERYGIYASARHAEVQAALTDWQTFSSAAGVGLDDFRRSKPFRPPSLILEADPPLHTRSRTVLNRALSAKAMAGLRAGFKDAAERLADGLVGRQRVDAIADIAEAYPLSVFPRAVGLGPEGLENLLPYGTMVFNAFGPRNAHFEASMARAAEVVGWINTQCARENLSPGGLGATIWAAVDSGEVSAQEAPLLVRSLLSAGLDTTIIGIGNGLYALAANPSQYQALRENPSLVRSAFDEILAGKPRCRLSFVRRPRRSNSAGSPCPPTPRSCCSSPPPIAIRAVGNSPSNSTSAVARAAMSRSAPAFTCVSGRCWRGSESELILSALLARFARIEIVAEPKRKLNNSLRQFASLPVELTPA